MSVAKDDGEHGSTEQSSNPSQDFEKETMSGAFDKLSSSEKGLTEQEAKSRLDSYGKNALVEKRAHPVIKFRLSSVQRG